MKSVLAVVIFLLLNCFCFAQRIATTHLLKYTQKDGLPSYNVRKVLQDSKGFIWVGTQDGISRFDGRTFLSYAKSAAPKNKICGVDVREMVEDTTKNLLWVLPAEVGINAISTITGAVVQTAVIPDAGMEDWNISLLKDKELLWIGTSTGVKVFNTSKGVYEKALPLPRPAIAANDFEVRSLVKDAYGNLWAACSGYGILIYSPDSRMIIKSIPLSSFNDHAKSRDIRFYGYATPKAGEILFATNQGLRKINYSSSYAITINNAPCSSIPALNTGSIDCISINKQGGIFLSGEGKLYQFDALLTNYTTLEEPARTWEADWLEAVQCVYQDKENNTWLGCQEGLAFIPHYPSPFRSFNYDKQTNIKLEHVRSIYVSDDKSILAGLRNGLVSIDNTGRQYTKPLKEDLYHHIFQDRQGRIHVARRDGMFIYQHGSITPIATIYPEFKPYAALPVNSHLFLGDSLVVLGTESSNGILLWNTHQKTVRKIEQSDANSPLASSIVNNIYHDQKGRTWVLSDNVISILSPDFTKGDSLTLPEKGTGQHYKLFFDMCEARGHYWIASYGSGIIQLDSSLHIKRVINTASHLSNDGVYQLFNVNNQQLVVTSNNGLSVVDLTDYHVKTYYTNNGLHSNGFEEVAGLMKDGKIYTGGVNGFTIIDPTAFSINLTPPILYIDHIQVRTKDKVLDTSDITLQSLEIGSDAVQTTIYLAGLNFSDPEKVSIDYKINEQHTDWINIGNASSLPLIGMGPGTYHVQLRASNEDGVHSEIKLLTLDFLPTWYETWWFKLLLLLTGLSIIYTVYRLRIAQLRKENEIRSKLASDLHDDLGSTMNSIKVYTNLALMEKQREGYLYKIKESAQEAIVSIRDLIWVLDDSRDSIENLFARIYPFAAPLSEANNIIYKEIVADDAKGYKLGQEEKRNLYMMLKESVNNAVKYSEAQSITISCSLKRGKPVFLVTDDGKGFDLKKENEGNGLKNMQRRAGQIHYHITITSSPGQGTSILLQKMRVA
ncbi:hypothetical protein D3H65_28050 [Paraflavitalea soli]|uniref:histidine kinase n=1 Tax=Paraflavitalea soli TaxID=2315862 RepID=A0A3B7MX18_9BACT|nr:two-component regulator propeller domain-containing protein [Paraflavitalea soli]AXY77600.1 hypothetical protein D3H65_28050 [Paraflavitalea soli]